MNHPKDVLNAWNGFGKRERRHALQGALNQAREWDGLGGASREQLAASLYENVRAVHHRKELRCLLRI